MSESTEEATTEVQEPTIGQELGFIPLDNEEETTEETETIETEPDTKEPVEETKTDEVIYLNIEDDGDKMFKLKINGEESTITVKDALRRIQTDKHLTQEGQRLAEERRQLNELKNSVADESAKPKPKEDWDTSYEDETVPNSDIADLKAQIATLTDAVGSVKQNLAPTVYEQNVKVIDNYLREQGYDDFMVYRPRVEEHFMTLSIEDQAKVSEVDLISKYKDLKIQDMAKNAEQKSTEPAENRPAIVNVIGGSSTPSGADEDDLKYSKAFSLAQETGDWRPVYKLKEIF